MEGTKQPSDDERTLSPIISNLASDSSAATQPLLSSLIQTLEQTDLDGVASLERSIRTIIACRRRALNDKNSPLLRLPTELLVTIGYLVVNKGGEVFPPDKKWWTAFGALLSVSTRLRQGLDTMRSDQVRFNYTLTRSTNLVEKCREIALDLAYYRGGSHRGPMLIRMGMYYSAGLSAAAALAAFVECSVFGQLQQPPVVYIESIYRGSYEKGEGGDGKGPTMFPAHIWVGHARELSLRVWKCISYGPDVVKEGPISMRRAKEVWKRVEEARNQT